MKRGAGNFPEKGDALEKLRGCSSDHRGVQMVELRPGPEHLNSDFNSDRRVCVLATFQQPSGRACTYNRHTVSAEGLGAEHSTRLTRGDFISHPWPDMMQDILEELRDMRSYWVFHSQF